MNPQVEHHNILIAVGVHSIALRNASELLASRLGGSTQAWLMFLLGGAVDELKDYTPSQLEQVLQELLAAALKTRNNKAQNQSGE